MWGGRCSLCGAYSTVIVLFVILVVVGVLVLLFFLWQVLLNPLIGSPFIFALRLAETLAILGQSAIKWPSQVITDLAPSGLGHNRLEGMFCDRFRSTPGAALSHTSG